MKHCISVTALAVCLLAALRAHAGDIGNVYVGKRTKTTIDVTYNVHSTWKVVGKYRLRWWTGGTTNSTNPTGEDFTTDTTFTITGLKPGTTYSITVWANSSPSSGPKLLKYRQVNHVTTSTRLKFFDICDNASWYIGGEHAATFDGQNCFLENLSAYGVPMILSNKYYLSAKQTCPNGTLDGDKCLVMKKPPFGFIHDNGFYMKADMTGQCMFGKFDTRNCFIAKAAPGTVAFEKYGNFYTTPLVTCAAGEPSSGAGGPRCYVGTPPDGRAAFVFNGAFYYE